MSSSVLLLSDGEDSLQERLRVRPGEDFDPIPCQLLRKYVGYARKYVHPRLSTEAADVLQVSPSSPPPFSLSLIFSPLAEILP